jgi:hypothetical protein
VIQKDNDEAIVSLVPFKEEHYKQKEPLSKPLYTDTNNAAKETIMRTSGDIIAHGNELTNIGELEDRSLIE